MEEVTIEHINPYLPYNVAVQYEGVINGNEIRDYKREWQKEQKEDSFFISYEGYKEPDEIKGLKIGFIKTVHYYLNGIQYRIGVKTGGLQTHYGTDRFKMLLQPMSDLTKEELIKQGFECHIDYLTHEQMPPLKAPAEMVNFLFSKYYDVFGLIDKGLAIDLKTLNTPTL